MESQHSVVTTLPSFMSPSYQSNPKRARTRSSSSRSRRSGRKAIYPSQKTWPYRTPGWGPRWDPFPSKATAIMRYSEVVTLDASAGIPASYRFRANSIYDPNLESTGHQPYGHDTYQSIYNHYCVTSSVITVQATSSYNGIFGVTVCDDSVVNTDYDTVRETKGTSVGTMQSGAAVPKIMQKYNRYAQFGDLQNVHAQSANFGSNPSEVSIFHVWTEGTNIGSDPDPVRLLVNITYTV